MKSLAARLRRHANPKPEEVEEDIERVRRRLQSETQGMQEILLRFTPPRRAGRTRRAIELVVAASFLAAVAVLAIVPRLDGAAAVVEAGDEGLHRIVKGQIQPLRVGQKVDSGEIIRADGASSATLAFDDGSRVEMGPTSELSLDNSRRVLRVHLNEGSIIVSAGKAIEKSFSIQTQDATVSLEDTVSVVAIEQERSRVAVIKGQALVEESGTARRLRSGEEIATGALMAASRPLIEEVAWSRLIREHLEVLQQAKPTESERFEVNTVRREKENPGLRGSPVRCNAVDGIFPLPPRALTAGVIGDSSTVPRGRCVGRYVTLMTLITVAYDVPERNISGGPDWARSMSETFQIEAKAEATSTATKDQLRVMLQKLLEERFKLRIRRHSKDAPGYALVVSTNGSKLQQTSGDAELYLEQNGRRNQFNLMRGGQISIKGRATIQAFANYLSVAPVIALNHVADKTGLPGMYEFSLTLNMVAPEFQALGTRGGGDSAGGPRIEWDPSISKAIEEQLGLSLVSQRVFEEVIVIEHAEKPSDN